MPDIAAWLRRQERQLAPTACRSCSGNGRFPLPAVPACGGSSRRDDAEHPWGKQPPLCRRSPTNQRPGYRVLMPKQFGIRVLIIPVLTCPVSAGTTANVHSLLTYHFLAGGGEISCSNPGAARLLVQTSILFPSLTPAASAVRIGLSRAARFPLLHALAHHAVSTRSDDERGGDVFVHTRARPMRTAAAEFFAGDA